MIFRQRSIVTKLRGSERMNIPNIITIFRIILIPIFLLVFHSNMENRVLYSGLIFLVSGISDILDGYIARKYDLGTKLGAVLDPFADKLMSFAVLISFTLSGLIPYWILMLILIKEVIMIIGGAILYFKNENLVIPSNVFGKAATFLLYLSILSIALKLSFDISMILLILTVVFNIIAFINYLKIFLGMNNGNNLEL